MFDETTSVEGRGNCVVTGCACAMSPCACGRQGLHRIYHEGRKSSTTRETSCQRGYPRARACAVRTCICAEERKRPALCAPLASASISAPPAAHPTAASPASAFTRVRLLLYCRPRALRFPLSAFAPMQGLRALQRRPQARPPAPALASVQVLRMISAGRGGSPDLLCVVRRTSSALRGS